MGCCDSLSPGKIVVDSIHGDIHLTQREIEVIDTPSFQRLRRLKQLAMAQMTYPNATHTRFAHSLGVFAIMARVLDIAKATGVVKLSKKESEDLRLAAMLHDVGHYPYSHLVERIDGVKLTEEQVENAATATRTLDRTAMPYPEHETVGTLIVENRPDLVEALGGRVRAKRVAKLFGPRQAETPELSTLIHSSLDMDRLDYLLRDSQASGVPYGLVDINYMLNNLKISPSGMVGIKEKALPAAEQFLLARFFMHRTVYYHKTTFGMEELCRQLLRRIRDSGKYDVPKSGSEIETLVKSERLLTFTDAFVDEIILKAAGQKEDLLIRTLGQAIQKRQPPRLLKEVNTLSSPGQLDQRGTVFKLNCKHKLRSLASDFGDLPLGQFILCETPPLKMEKRGPLVLAQNAGQWKEEEELIKVFIADEPEPKSLVDIPHSIISKCGGFSFKSFRLYVVYDGTDREKTLGEMAHTVKDWDKS
jgi:uncharacterized protein